MSVEFTCYSLLNEYVTYKSMNISWSNYTSSSIRYNYIVTASRIPYYISIPKNWKTIFIHFDISSHAISLGLHHLLLQTQLDWGLLFFFFFLLVIQRRSDIIRRVSELMYNKNFEKSTYGMEMRWCESLHSNLIRDLEIKFHLTRTWLVSIRGDVGLCFSFFNFFKKNFSIEMDNFLLSGNLEGRV